ncbi:MAG TPA: methionyl-tRNA formyltransferase [Nevskiaceae bacterium]|nr:methionyl-tRNA formyltransferase [Nevskiaceae bacterium]
MRLIFAGTPAFSVPALDALKAAGHELIAVYTQPDRPAGRGQKLSPSPVAQRAQALGLPVFQPLRLRGNAEELERLRGLGADLMVVVAYGLILPAEVLAVPRLGCLNIHASLLPRWRGAAPIQRALLAGDPETGTTIMQMDAGLDTGPMLLREALPIGAETTAAELHEALSAQGARLIVEALRRLQAGELTPTPQPAEGVCYAPKLDKTEARLDWRLPAVELARRVRAYHPVPVAWCETAAGERLRIWRARAEGGAAEAAPGTVLGRDREGIRIACGEGRLCLTELQWPGGTRGAASQTGPQRLVTGERLP